MKYSQEKIDIPVENASSALKPLPWSRILWIWKLNRWVHEIQINNKEEFRNGIKEEWHVISAEYLEGIIRICQID